MKRLILTLILCSGMTCVFDTRVQAQTDGIQRHQLEPRSEWNIRTGSERTTGIGELWIPLVQDPLAGSVLYGDFRFMDDNLDNQEYNVGLGYRTMNNDIPLIGHGIVGVHGWIDRRHTDRGTHFNQMTIGTEIFTEDLDAKVNVYAPLNKQKTHVDPNPNGTNPQFVGNVLTVNTNQIIVEEAMPGFDIELGARVPWMDDYTDSTRFYAGAYHFEGHRADNITGFRTRLSADITSNIQIGGRFQHDDVRGGQGFLEATFRLPFGNKQSYRQTGLYARLDESPERDIDIVSNEAITDNGFNKPLINTTTGDIQNIIHVDNTTAGGGDGSNEARFNTLAAAQGAAGANDLIYIHRGDGTTTGQNSGITHAHEGMKLIGSGVDLTFDTARFNVKGTGINPNQILIPATSAPIITNTGGFGVNTLSDSVYLSGFSINGTSSTGLRFQNSQDSFAKNIDIIDAGSSGVFMTYTDDRNHNLTLKRISVSNNSANHAFNVDLRNNTTLNINLSNLNAEDFTGNGLSAISRNNSELDIKIKDSTMRNGSATAINIIGTNNAKLNALIEKNQIYDATSTSVGVNMQGTSIAESVTIRDNHLDGVTPFRNILARVTSNAVIENLLIEENDALNGGSASIFIDDCCTVGGTSRINNTTIRNNTINGASGIGIFISKSRTLGNFTNVSIHGNTIQNNGTNGLQISSTNDQGGIIASIYNNLISNNGGTGVLINDDTTSAFMVDLGGGSLGSTGGNQIFDNIGRDINVDLDGGVLKAEGNWWGTPTGLSVDEITLSDGSTIDADPFLTTAP
jgi:hypothetical protein